MAVKEMIYCLVHGGNARRVTRQCLRNINSDLRDINEFTVRRINSISICDMVNGEPIESFEKTREERTERLRILRFRQSLPDGVRIELYETSGLAVLYYNDSRYNPRRKY